MIFRKSIVCDIVEERWDTWTGGRTSASTAMYPEESQARTASIIYGQLWQIVYCISMKQNNYFQWSLVSGYIIVQSLNSDVFNSQDFELVQRQFPTHQNLQCPGTYENVPSPQLQRTFSPIVMPTHPSSPIRVPDQESQPCPEEESSIASPWEPLIGANSSNMDEDDERRYIDDMMPCYANSPGPGWAGRPVFCSNKVPNDIDTPTGVSSIDTHEQSHSEHLPCSHESLDAETRMSWSQSMFCSNRVEY